MNYGICASDSLAIIALYKLFLCYVYVLLTGETASDDIISAVRIGLEDENGFC